MKESFKGTVFIRKTSSAKGDGYSLWIPQSNFDMADKMPDEEIMPKAEK